MKKIQLGLLSMFCLSLLVVCGVAVNHWHKRFGVAQGWVPGDSPDDLYARAHHRVVTGATGNDILLATWCAGRATYYVCKVDAKGRVFTVRDVYLWAAQNNRIAQMSQPNLKRLRFILQTLPPGSQPSSQTPPHDRQLIISFNTGTRRATRIYDRGKLPRQVNALYHLTGAPLSYAPLS
jgi:hypothetical protein